MTVVGFLILLVIAAVVGSIAQAIAGYSSGGCLASIAVGFIGALLGMWISRAMKLPEMFVIAVGPERFPVIWSIIGATLFVALIRLITSLSRRREP